MNEQSKAAKRRFNDGNFISKYFVGAGLDIGCGPDSVGQYKNAFPLIQTVMPWDMPQGDAMYLETLSANSFNFVHSSHCLEHMVDVTIALQHWTRVLRPGGYMVITVPDEDMYEHGIWPSKNNSDHKWSFTMCKKKSVMPRSINVTDLANKFADVLQCIKLHQIDDFFYPNIDTGFDQTLTPNAECAIEMIFRKR